MEGVGKLIELLNEYEGYSKDAFNRWRYDEYGYITEGGDYLYIGTEQKIVSKRFGFIERLVENDKIDTNKLEKIGYEKTIYGYDGQYREIEEYSDYEALLMLLAISDNPIDFLCEIIKN